MDDDTRHVTIVITQEVMDDEQIFRLTFVGENGMAQVSSCSAAYDRKAQKHLTAYENAEEKMLKWLRAEFAKEE